MKPVPIGARAEHSETVEFRHTLSAHHDALPLVYSTPDMIRLMETACFHALLPYHDEGEINVGTAVNVEHRAASGVGSKVTAEAALESFDGRFYVLRVRAWVEGEDGGKEIGRGTVSRAVINVTAFLSKTQGGRR